MESFDLARAADGAAAVRQAAAPGAKYIAGGTDLMQLMKDGVERPRHLVDIAGLPLDAVEDGADGLTIGALVTMADLAVHPAVVERYPAVSAALLASASPQVRNMATIGGNLLQRTRCGYFRDTGFPCNKRDPGSGCPAIAGENRMHAILGGSDQCVATHPSDLAVALVMLDATLEVSGPAGPRRLDVAALHRLPGSQPERDTELAPGELITAVRLPADPIARRSAYLKVRDRASFEFALVSAAVAVELAAGRIARARVAMGGVGTRPWRLPAVEQALIGRPIEAVALAGAAAQAAQGARPLAQNAFKVTLMQRTLVRAVLQAGAAA
jgi:xanthine dehydrogenase YagS FAD-binding subunit